MKVQLIVVQGKPEGKIIPLVGPKFKIGRGETCHLRPGSEQVSREHAEFSLTEDTVSVQDLGSRNGTLVNGKAITESVILKDKDLVQVGPLTFSLAIQGAAVAAATAKAGAVASSAKATPEDVSHDEIESWLVSDTKSPMPERPSGIYPGDTITITAFKDGGTKPPTRVEPRRRLRLRNTSCQSRRRCRRGRRDRRRHRGVVGGFGRSRRCGRDARGIHRRIQPLLQEEERRAGEARQALVQRHERRGQ